MSEDQAEVEAEGAGWSRRRKAALAGGLVTLALAVGAGGYAIGNSSGEDLDAARSSGAAEGDRIGTAEGTREGYAEGFKEGRKDGYDATYEKAYADAYRKAFEESGLEAPRHVKVRE